VHIIDSLFFLADRLFRMTISAMMCMNLRVTARFSVLTVLMAETLFLHFSFKVPHYRHFMEIYGRVMQILPHCVLQ